MEDPRAGDFIGRKVVFDTTMYFTRDLKEDVSGPVISTYDCYLVREREKPNFKDNMFNNGILSFNKADYGIQFKVVDSFIVTPRGIQKSFSPEYRILVLEDEKGIKCTVLESGISEREWIQ